MLSDMFFRQETRVAIVPTVAETFVAACDGVIDALPCVFGWTIASQLYQETNEKERIAAQILRKRILLMKPQENFNCGYFTDLIDLVYLDSATGDIQLQTKTATIIEGVNSDGGKEDSEENRHAD